MEGLLRHLRHAIRRLRRSPGFTAIAILSLALGIGANTAIFSVVNAVVLKKPPVTDPDRLVDVYVDMPGFSATPPSYPEYEDVRNRTDVFSGVATMAMSMVRRDLDDGVVMLPAELVSGNLFRVLGLRPTAGRLLVPEDDTSPGSGRVVVLAYDYWQRAFDGRPDAVGRDIRLNGQAYTIVGVAPEDYDGTLRGFAPDLYAPITMINHLQPLGGDALSRRGQHAYFTKARLAPDATLAEAETAMASIEAYFRQTYPEYWPEDNHFRLVPSSDVIVNPMADGVIAAASAVLLAAAALVLLVACANLASYLLARGWDRRREIAVRLALGAGRGSLIRSFLTETVLLALVGGAGGLLLAVVTLQALMSLQLPMTVPISLDLSPDTTVLAFTLLVSLAAGVIFGLVPALQATRMDVAPTLKDESTGRGGRSRLRGALVAGQVAVSLVVLVSAGLFFRSLLARQNVDPGFGDAPTGLVSVVLDAQRYDAQARLRFLDRAVGEVGNRPGITAVGAIDNLPLNVTSMQQTGVNIDGVDPPPGRLAHSIDYARVDSGYFAAVGIPIVEGRNFRHTDAEHAPEVMIVNRTMARRFWPDRSAVGRIVRDSDGDPVRVVGVAGDTKVRSLGEPPRPFVYRPLRQSPATLFTLVARTTGNAETATATTLAAVREIDPDIIIWESKTLEEHLAVMVMPARLGASALTGFAALALVLAVIGLYGMVSYAVASRSREVGIRMSLGAESGRVVRLLMRDGVKLVLIGAAVGLALAVLLGRVLRSLLFGVTPLDPVTLVGGVLLLLVVAGAAAWVPARRASRVDPARALRTE
jgi:predicted permease